MIPLMRFNIKNTDEKTALQHAARFDLIEHIHPQGGNNKGSVVHIGGRPYLSTDHADELQARLEGFYATRQLEEKEKAKVMRDRDERNQSNGEDKQPKPTGMMVDLDSLPFGNDKGPLK